MMVNELAPKISDSELEVMRVLWRAGDALPVTEIRETLQKSRGWEATTVKTLVSRLVSKGVLRQEKRGVFYYTPQITEKEYRIQRLGHPRPDQPGLSRLGQGSRCRPCPLRRSDEK